jgi:hypothetical protein
VRTMSHITDWPTNVLYRALTHNGAPIDITETDPDYRGETGHRVECGGCGRGKDSAQLYRKVNPDLFDWADEHAVKCRFLPRNTTPTTPLKAV